MINEELSNALKQKIESQIEGVSSNMVSNSMYTVHCYATDLSKRSMDKLLERVKNPTNTKQVKLSELVEKGKTELIDISTHELSQLKEELNKNGINFSITKNNDPERPYSVYFQAKDVNIFNKALQNTLTKVERNQNKISVQKKVKALQKQVKAKRKMVKKLERSL